MFLINNGGTTLILTPAEFHTAKICHNAQASVIVYTLFAVAFLSTLCYSPYVAAKAARAAYLDYLRLKLNQLSSNMYTVHDHSSHILYNYDEKWNERNHEEEDQGIYKK